MRAWDERALLWVNQHDHPWLDSVLYPISFAGEKGLILVLLVVGLLWVPRRDWPLWAGIAFALMILDRLLFDAVSLAYFRERPFLALDGVRQVGPPWYTSSFPSGHAHYAWLATVLLGAHRRGLLWLLVPFALLTCYARPYFGMHYPLDVVAGSLTGVAFGVFVVYCQRAWRRRVERSSVPAMVSQQQGTVERR